MSTDPPPIPTPDPAQVPFARVEFEPRSECNLACAPCPNATQRRPVEELPLPAMASLAQSLGRMGFSGAVSPHFYNEPLTDARLEDVLGLFRRHAPRARIELFSNFTLMTVERYERLLPLVDIFIVTPENPLIAEALDRFVARSLHRVDLSRIVKRSPPARSRGTQLGHATAEIQCQGQSGRCGLGADTLIIDAWGDVRLCANDFAGPSVFGNIKERDPYDLWFDPEFMAARRQVGGPKHAPCRTCHLSGLA